MITGVPRSSQPSCDLQTCEGSHDTNVTEHEGRWPAMCQICYRVYKRYLINHNNIARYMILDVQIRKRKCTKIVWRVGVGNPSWTTGEVRSQSSCSCVFPLSTQLQRELRVEMCSCTALEGTQSNNQDSQHQPLENKRNLGKKKIPNASTIESKVPDTHLQTGALR